MSTGGSHRGSIHESQWSNSPLAAWPRWQDSVRGFGCESPVCRLTTAVTQRAVEQISEPVVSRASSPHRTRSVRIPRFAEGVGSRLPAASVAIFLRLHRRLPTASAGRRLGVRQTGSPEMPSGGGRSPRIPRQVGRGIARLPGRCVGPRRRWSRGQGAIAGVTRLSHFLRVRFCPLPAAASVVKSKLTAFATEAQEAGLWLANKEAERTRRR